MFGLSQESVMIERDATWSLRDELESERTRRLAAEREIERLQLSVDVYKHEETLHSKHKATTPLRLPTNRSKTARDRRHINKDVVIPPRGKMTYIQSGVQGTTYSLKVFCDTVLEKTGLDCDLFNILLKLGVRDIADCPHVTERDLREHGISSVPARKIATYLGGGAMDSRVTASPALQAHNSRSRVLTCSGSYNHSGISPQRPSKPSSVRSRSRNSSILQSAENIRDSLIRTSPEPPQYPGTDRNSGVNSCYINKRVGGGGGSLRSESPIRISSSVSNNPMNYISGNSSEIPGFLQSNMSYDGNNSAVALNQRRQDTEPSLSRRRSPQRDNSVRSSAILPGTVLGNNLHKCNNIVARYVFFFFFFFFPHFFFKDLVFKKF